MARLTRKTSKLFCENALQSDVGQFGSLNAGTKVETKDIDTIQNLAAWQDGWQAAGLGLNCYPTRQERNGLDYVQSYMVNYLNQEGIAEYDAGTTYYTGSVVKLINGTDVQLFKSIADSNTGNALTNTSYWEELSFGGSIAVTYADGTTSDLEEVVYQTESTYAGRSTFPNTQMDVVEFMGETPLYFANAKTISASTNYTYTLNGTFCTGSSSVATVTITDSNSNSVTVYGNVVRIPANCTFSSSVAGKFYFDNNYYGYLAS